MTKNVTIRPDEGLIKKFRHAAVEENLSLSKWIAKVLVKSVSQRQGYLDARERSLKRLERGFHLQRSPLSRSDIYER